MNTRREDKRAFSSVDLVACALLAMICLAVSARAWNSEFTYPDAARHAMDGVFVHDFLRAPNWANPWKFALSYYGRYPCVAFMLYYPPGYAVFQAPFFWIFGVNVFAVTMAAVVCLIGFAVLWYLWVSRFGGRWIAFWGGAFAVSSVVFVRWAGEAMLEIPALFLLTCASAAYMSFLKNGGLRRLVLAALVFGLAIETKQTAAFLLPALVAAPFLLDGKSHFNRRNVSLSLVAFILVCAPVGYVTARFGGANLAAAAGDARTPLLSIENWTTNFRFLATTQIGLALAFLGLAGAIFAAAKRDKAMLFLVLFAAANYLAFSLVSYKSSRLSMFWVPAVATLGVYAVCEIGGKKRYKELKVVLVILLALFQGAYLFRFGKFITVKGYKEAAKYVAAQTGGAHTVLIQAHHNGNFIFHMRAQDRQGRYGVLRSSKLLYSTAVMPQFGTKVFHKTETEILELMQRLGTRFVVIENRAVRKEEDNDATRALRRLVRGPEFARRKVVPVQTSDPLLKGLRLEIYEYRDSRELKDGVLEIDLMSIGKKVKIPLEGRRSNIERP